MRESESNKAVGVQCLIGRSTLTLRSMGLAPRLTADAVSTTNGFESMMRPASDYTNKVYPEELTEPDCTVNTSQTFS